MTPVGSSLGSELKARREPELPDFAESELRKRRRYPNFLSLTADIDIVYRCSRYRSVALSRRAVERSEMFGWLLQGGKKVGAIVVDSYRLERCHDNEEFIDVMDAEGGYEYELARTLTDAWIDVRHEVASYGPLLEFQAVWIATEHRRADLLKQIIQLVTTQIFPTYSVIVLKAWPGSGLSAPKAASRRSAVMRYYARLIGAKPFAGGAGRSGWMWAAHPRLRDEVMPSRQSVSRPSIP